MTSTVFNAKVVPMVAMYVSELASTGKMSTGTFQMLSAGNTAQPATTGGARRWVGVASELKFEEVAPRISSIKVTV